MENFQLQVGCCLGAAVFRRKPRLLFRCRWPPLGSEKKLVNNGINEVVTSTGWISEPTVGNHNVLTEKMEWSVGSWIRLFQSKICVSYLVKKPRNITRIYQPLFTNCLWQNKLCNIPSVYVFRSNCKKSRVSISYWCLGTALSWFMILYQLVKWRSPFFCNLIQLYLCKLVN